MIGRLARSMSTPRPALPYTRTLPRSAYPTPLTYDPQDLLPYNTRPDSEFYAHPRINVQHIDDATILALKAYYTEVLREGDEVVDLASSWTSHLPAPPEETPIGLASLIGVGMSQPELDANPLLTQRLTRDLNISPTLPSIPASSIDAIICSVSIDYLTSPVPLFVDLARIVKSGGRMHLAFGDRCFPDKVLRRWLDMGDEERRRWVGGYFWASNEAVAEGGMTSGAQASGLTSSAMREGLLWTDVEEVIIRDGRDRGDKLFVVRGTRV